VADKFDGANCQTVAPPALGDTQQGKAAAPGGTAAAQSFRAFRGSKSAKAAAAANQDPETAASRAASGSVVGQASHHDLIDLPLARLAHNIEAERQACEIRLRAERKAGTLSRELEKK
jgi:hypothetical protein